MKLNLTLSTPNVAADLLNGSEIFPILLTVQGEDFAVDKSEDIEVERIQLDLLSRSVILEGGLHVNTLSQEIDFESTAVRMVVGSQRMKTFEMTVSFNDGTGGGCNCEIVDELTSRSSTAALSANQGRVLNERLLALEEAGNPTSLNVSISPTSLQKNGTSTTVTITVTASKKDGTRVDVEDIVINGIPRTSPTTFENVTKSTTYTVNATAGGKKVSGSKAVTFCSPIYVGFSPGSLASEVKITDLKEQSLRSSLGTLTPTINENKSVNNYLWIFSPYKVSKVTSDGFAADMNPEEKLTQDGVLYYCYRSASKSALGTFNLSIS